MTFKKILGTVALVTVAGLSLAACSGGNTTEKDTVRVGIMAKNASEEARWNKVEELVKKEGITLKFTEFTDYSQPNKALANGEVDINAFQHYNYLNNWNKENKSDLVGIGDTYISPIRLYSGIKDGKNRYKSLEELPEKATIAIQNDAVNESRSLRMLQQAGLLTLKDSGKEFATVADIAENPKQFEIKELDASQTAHALSSVDAAVVNNDFVSEAKIDYKKALYVEKPDSNAKQWINIIAAQKDWKKSEKADAIQKVVDAYHTEDVKKAIVESSDGLDEPVFEVKK